MNGQHDQWAVAAEACVQSILWIFALHIRGQFAFHYNFTALTACQGREVAVTRDFCFEGRETTWAKYKHCHCCCLHTCEQTDTGAIRRFLSVLVLLPVFLPSFSGVAVRASGALITCFAVKASLRPLQQRNGPQNQPLVKASAVKWCMVYLHLVDVLHWKFRANTSQCKYKAWSIAPSGSQQPVCPMSSLPGCQQLWRVGWAQGFSHRGLQGLEETADSTGGGSTIPRSASEAWPAHHSHFNQAYMLTQGLHMDRCASFTQVVSIALHCTLHEACSVYHSLDLVDHRLSVCCEPLV